MRVLGYIRCSTSMQAENGVSLEHQAAQVGAYCKFRGFNLVEVIEDRGVSGGKTASREGFVALLDAVETRDVDALVIYDLSRLSRDMLVLLAFERLLDECGIELHTVEGQVDTSTPDGWLSFAMKSFLGEVERRQVKHRTKQAMAHLKRQSAVVGSIPFGFRREGDALVPDEAEQTVVAIVNSLYAGGKNLSEICRSLEAQGHLSRTGKPFVVQQVKRLLPDYRETFKRKRTEMGNTIQQFIRKVA